MLKMRPGLNQRNFSAIRRAIDGVANTMIDCGTKRHIKANMVLKISALEFYYSHTHLTTPGKEKEKKGRSFMIF